MPKQLKYIAQQCLDLFYQNYKSDIEFWALMDAIEFTGNAAAGLYQEFYQQEYAMLRSEVKDSVIQFDTGWLDEQILPVKTEDGIVSAELKFPVMTFPYDRQQIGIQNVIYKQQDLDRISFSAAYQLKYLPVTPTMFFYGDRARIVICNTGTKTIDEVRVLYVPSMNADANIPDGIIEKVIMATLNLMRQAADKTVVKKSLDQNVNKILETEIDKSALK